jgi:hypothetical protein
MPFSQPPKGGSHGCALTPMVVPLSTSYRVDMVAHRKRKILFVLFSYEIIVL